MAKNHLTAFYLFAVVLISLTKLLFVVVFFLMLHHFLSLQENTWTHKDNS